MIVAGVIKPSVLPSQSPNTSTDDTVALDFAGPLSKADILAVLNQFFRQPEVKSLAMQQGPFSLLSSFDTCLYFSLSHIFYLQYFYFNMQI